MSVFDKIEKIQYKGPITKIQWPSASQSRRRVHGEDHERVSSIRGCLLAHLSG